VSDDSHSLEVKLWRLAEILAAAKRIHSSLTLSEVLESFLDIAIGEVGGEGGTIYLRKTSPDGLVVAHRRLPSKATVDQSGHCDRLAGEALKRNETTQVTDKKGDATIISLPLRDETGTGIGVLQIYRPAGSELDDGDRLFLKELSHFASLSIRNAQYHSDSLVKARLEREIAVARDIQLGTLPREMPALPGYDLAGLSRPADETGGDSFDLVPWGDSGLMLLLADATGHGIGPALSVTQVRAMLRLSSRLRSGLDDVLRHINDQLCDDLQSNRFVTAFIGLLHSNEHVVRYHAPGQAPLMHFHAATGEFEWYGASSPPLGLFPTTKIKEPNDLRLAPGDILGLITDGVFEAENVAGNMFGKERVAAIVRECCAEPCIETTRRLMDGVDRHCGTVPQADDITIVLVRRLSQDH
jgi:phosphoserine phosphatase